MMQDELHPCRAVAICSSHPRSCTSCLCQWEFDKFRITQTTYAHTNVLYRMHVARHESCHCSKWCHGRLGFRDACCCCGWVKNKHESKKTAQVCIVRAVRLAALQRIFRAALTAYRCTCLVREIHHQRNTQRHNIARALPHCLSYDVRCLISSYAVAYTSAISLGVTELNTSSNVAVIT